MGKSMFSVFVSFALSSPDSEMFYLCNHVRLANLTDCYRRKNALIFGSSLIGTLLFKLIDFYPDDEKEQGDAKVAVEKTQVKITREKTKKEPDGWRQNTGRDETRGGGLGQENNRIGTQDRYENGDEAEIDDEAEDKYEDEAENEKEEEDDEDEDDEDDGGPEEEDDDEGEEGPVPEPIPEDAIFIPLGLVRQRRTPYYKGSDPEWQSFVEVSRDRKRSIGIRSTLYFHDCITTRHN